MGRWIYLCLMLISLSCKEQPQREITEKSQDQHSVEMKESMSRGAGVYNDFCASCHLSNGEGIKGVFPPLKNSDWLMQKREASIRAIKFGLKGPIEVNGEDYDNLMPAPGLSDEEIADVMNYINHSWGNSSGPRVTAEEVSSIAK